METNKQNSVCPVEKAGALDISLRRLIHDPKKILGPYLSGGMSVLDLGCGPGFFSLVMADLVGDTGKVVAADLQRGMLDKVSRKIHATPYEKLITLHQCGNDTIGLAEKFDLILIFYMLHEVPDQSRFMKELGTLLSDGGRILIVEPKFHVSDRSFQESVTIFRQAGFEVLDRPTIFFSRAVLLVSAG